MTNTELVALLREARDEWLRYHDLYTDGVELDEKLLSRIDAALAVHEASDEVQWEEGTDYEKKPWYEAWIGHIGLHIRRWPWRSHKEPEVFYWHVWSPLDEDGQAATLDEAKSAAIAAARGIR